MVINVQCTNCDTRLKVGDEAAGKSGKCPSCGNPVQVPEAIYDAEVVAEEVAEEFDFPGAEPHESGHPPARNPVGAASGGPPTRRRPCPACGEQVVASAAKCRFCGEILDESIRSTRIAERGSVDPEDIKKFRRGMHGLGGLWIFIGGIGLLAGLAMLNERGDPEEVSGMFIIVFSALCLTGGICTCMKQMWAVYVGLALAYLSTFGNLSQLASGNGNIFTIVMLVAAIAQGHSSLIASKKLRNAGIPLTTKE